MKQKLWGLALTLVALLALTVSASAADVTIETGGTAESPSDALVTALGTADSGDTITLPAGYFTAPTEITQSVTIKGAGSTREPGDDDAITTLAAAAPIVIKTDNITVSFEALNLDADVTNTTFNANSGIIQLGNYASSNTVHPTVVTGIILNITDCYTIEELTSKLNSAVSLTAVQKSFINVENSFLHGEYTFFTMSYADTTNSNKRGYVHDTQDVTYTIKNSTLSGWTGGNMRGERNIFTATNCTIIGTNVNSGSSNEYSSFIMTDGSIGGSYTFNNCHIFSENTGDQNQNCFAFQYGATNNTLTLNNCTYEIVLSNGVDSAVLKNSSYNSTIYPDTSGNVVIINDNTYNMPTVSSGSYEYYDIIGDLLVPHGTIAMIDDTYYTSLSVAIGDAETDDIITLLVDIDVKYGEGTISSDDDFTIDLAGCTMTVVDDLGELGLTIFNNMQGALVITDSSDDQSGEFIISADTKLNNTGDLTIDCKLTNNGEISMSNSGNLYIEDDAELINNGTFANGGWCVISGGTITNNGTFTINYWIGIFDGATVTNGAEATVNVASGAGVEYDAIPENEFSGCVAYYSYTDSYGTYYDYFKTLVAAISDAGADGTVILVDNVTEDITITQALTLDLNGCDLTGNVTNSDTLNIKDSIGTGVLDGTISNTGTVAISGGLFTEDIAGWAATGYEVTTQGEYYTVQPAAEVVYSVLGNTIYAKLNGVTVGKLSILAPDSLVYDGEVKNATIYNENSGVLTVPTITYDTTDGLAPTAAGTYTASFTAQGLTASITFAISKAPVTVTVFGNSFPAGTYSAPTYELTPDVDYTATYYDADGEKVTLSDNTPAGTYTIQVTLDSSNYYLSGTVGSVVVYEVTPPTEYTVTFDEDGGSAVEDLSKAIATTVRTLAEEPTKSGYAFTGWSYDGKIYTAGAQFVQPEADVVMTATWVLNSFTVSGTITDEDGIAVEAGTTVTLDKLNSDGTVASSTDTTTASNGTFSFTGVTMGEYNIVVTKTDEVEITTTTYIKVTGDIEVEKVMLAFSLSTSVAVSDELETTIVSGLETMAVAAVTADDADIDASEVGEVKIAVTVAVASDDTVLDAIADATSYDVGYTMDITVDMIVDEYEITPITETPELLSFTINLPAEMQGMAYYTVLRYHDDTVDTLKTSKNSDGEYIELVYTTIDDVKVATGIIIHAKFFSTYAITSSETAPSSGGTSYYTSSVASTSNGSVSISSSKSTMNSTITITTDPDSGYAVGDVTVAYSSGKTVSVTDNGDGTYSYKQPGASVTVTVTFVESDGETDDEDTFFEDVDTDDYFYDAVLWAVENGITAGTTDTTFSPNTICNRAQAVTFLYRAAGEPDVDGDTAFTDLDEDAYYYEAVLWAVENGITAGTTETTFSPYDSCTRGQIVTFLWRAAGEEIMDGDALDVDADSYCYDAVIWAVSEGITTGYTDGTFGASDFCTRAQIVTFLYRFLAE